MIKTLQEMLNKVSPDARVRLRDFDGENLLFEGYAGEVPKTAFYKYAEVRYHYFASGVMTIWIF